MKIKIWNHTYSTVLGFLLGVSLLVAAIWYAVPAKGQQQVQPVAGVLTLNIVPGTSSFKVILSANVTSVVIQNPTPGLIISVIFTENATGGFTVVFDGNIANPCTVSTTASATTICQFQYDMTSNTWNGIGGGVSFPILAPNGTVGAPSYSFTTQTGSGMYFNPSDIGGSPTIGLSTGGSAAIRCATAAGVCAVQNTIENQGGTSGITFPAAGAISMLASNRFKLSDQGSCTMTAGACTAQSLASTYSVAPLCFASATVAGGTVGTLKAPSTTTTVTPASSSGADTSTLNWVCFGN